MYNCIYSLRLKCIFNTFLLFLNVFIIIVFHFYTSFSNVSTAVIFIYAGLFLSTFWERGGGGCILADKRKSRTEKQSFRMSDSCDYFYQTPTYDLCFSSDIVLALTLWSVPLKCFPEVY